MNILFIGNNITLCSPQPEIGWTGFCAMAASCEENDYVNILGKMLTADGKRIHSRAVNVSARKYSGFEREPDTFDYKKFFASDRDFCADVIVMRIIENVPDEKLELFGELYPQLIDYLCGERHPIVICTGSFWSNDRGDELIKAAAESRGAIFVSLKDLQDESYRAAGMFDDPFVAAHPSDKGMRAIAEHIYAALAEAGVTGASRVYPLPQGEKETDAFKCDVDGKENAVYTCRVSAIPFNRTWPGGQRPLDQTGEAYFTYFDIGAQADITVTVGRAFSEAVIRPLSKNIKITPVGQQLHFTVSEPGQYSLELDGREQNLHIFANPAQSYPSLPDTLYYGPGVHEGGDIVLHSGQTLLVDAGAVLHASVRCEDSENVRIIGRGVIDYSGFERHDPLIWGGDGLINLERCENVLIDGVILRDSSWWTITSMNCRNLRFNNVKAIGMWRYNSDGFDFVNSQNVRVTNCFLRNFDDVIVLKGLRIFKDIGGKNVSMNYERMNMQNYLIEGCVLWCDWGGALEIGAETVADEYSNIIFRDCDILRNSDGGLRIQSGDRAYIHNVLYENIRVEYSKYNRASVYQHSDAMKYEPEDVPSLPAVICGWMYRDMWTQDHIYGNIRDVTYRDIYVTADEGIPVPPVSFMSADEEHYFDRITIDGLYFNGRRLTAGEIPLKTNEFTREIKIL